MVLNIDIHLHIPSIVPLSSPSLIEPLVPTPPTSTYKLFILFLLPSEIHRCPSVNDLCIHMDCSLLMFDLTANIHI